MWSHKPITDPSPYSFYSPRSFHRATTSELSRDWTATHELSHMLLPYVASRDRWLSESLASYYQNVLRARDGRLAPVLFQPRPPLERQ